MERLMSKVDTPVLSVILVTPDCYATIRTTVRHLLRQGIRDRIELVLVVPIQQELQANLEELKRFLCYQVVEVGSIQSIAQANCAGVRKARAPIIALGEDHAFPAAGWAEALVKANEYGFWELWRNVSRGEKIPASILQGAGSLRRFSALAAFTFMALTPLFLMARLPYHLVLVQCSAWIRREEQYHRNLP
jgi:hypothetical protein